VLLLLLLVGWQASLAAPAAAGVHAAAASLAQPFLDPQSDPANASHNRALSHTHSVHSSAALDMSRVDVGLRTLTTVPHAANHTAACHEQLD
jgi:hypothetical protein